METTVTRIRTALIAVFVGVAFYLEAKLGLVLATPPDYIATFWPPNTVILAALLLTERRRWWIYFLVMAPAYFIPAIQTGYSMQRAMIFFPANCTEILVAAFALRLLFRNRFKLDQIRDMVMFLIVAVLIAPVISAFIASIATFAEPDVNYWLAWRVWFLGDALGHLMLTPVIFLWVTYGFRWVKEISLVRLYEVLGLVLCTFAVGFFVLGAKIGAMGSFPVLLYSPLPVLLWAALRFGPRGACSALFAITLLAIWNAINGRGPFVANTPADNVLSMQLFLISASIPTMLLASIISERKKAELAVQNAREYSENIIATVREPLVVLDSSLRVISASISFYKAFMVSEKETRGNLIFELGNHQWDIPKLRELLENILPDKSVMEGFEVEHDFESIGKKVMMLNARQIIREEEEEGKLILLAIEDITERKKMEEALWQSEKLKSLGEITAGVAHEFNNLLAVIVGTAELLETDSKDDPGVKKGLNTIIKASDDGAEIVGNMISYTKLEVEETSSYISFNISKVLKEAIDFTMPRWKHMAQSKGIDYQIEIEGIREIPEVLCNPTELKGVFTNIINNALDAMPDGGRLSFSTWSSDDTLFVSISDTGKGMPDEVKKKVFDPFFTTRRPLGTGLGLSVSYSAIVRHGGKIEVDSEEGKGTTFNVSIPVRKVAFQKTESSEADQRVTRRKLHILVIDDNDDVCEIVGGVLTRGGHTVKIVDNGVEAIELVGKEDFDLILCDLLMPNIHGYDVIKVINKLGKVPKIGIMTGWAEDLKPADDVEFKVDFILKKPFKHAELAKHINNLFGAE